jgi:hypothetical protein
MDQGQFESMLLGVVLVDLTIAAVVLACVMTEGRRAYFFAAALGAATAWLAFPLFGVDTPNGGAFADVLLGAGIGALFAAMIRMFLEWSALAGLAAEIRNTLDIKLWLPETDMPRLTPRDRVRRIFVAVSAATGAVVFSMFGLEVFWEAFWQELTPFNLVGVTIAFVAGMFLVGPAQAYVFERGAAEGPDAGKELGWALQSGFDARAAMRLAIVLAMGLQFGLLMNCVNASVRTGDAQVLYTILNAALPPAIVSYYLSAALQLSVPRTIAHARRAALYGGAILNYGFALIITFNFFSEIVMSPDSNRGAGAGLTLFMSPVIAIGLALLFSAATTYLPAVATAYVIARRTGSAMIYIAAALIGVAILQGLMYAAFIVLAGFPAENIRIGSFAGGVAGWIVGLWASGFPRLLTERRADVQPAAPA